MTGNSPPATVRVAAEPAAWPTVAALAPARIALVVVDMQTDFIMPDGWLAGIGVTTEPMRAVVQPIGALLAAARAAGLTVVHTRQGNAADLRDLPAVRRHIRGIRNAGGATAPGLVRGEPGWQIVDALAPIAGELLIDKTGYSAFEGTALDAELRARSIEALVVAGVTTNVCVLATLLGGVDRGYDCLLVPDAVAADAPEITAAVLRILDHEGAVLGSRAPVAAVLRGLGPDAPA
ncbi:MAG: isochorismatase hydrolase [Actinomycetia bacterium]|nr:isochorismatase hydrolase [Actinomycetes bacterium]